MYYLLLPRLPPSLPNKVCFVQKRKSSRSPRNTHEVSVPFLKILPSATDLNSDLEGGVQALCQSIRQEIVLFFRR